MFVIVVPERESGVGGRKCIFFENFFVKTYLSLHSGLKPSGKVRKQSETASH